MDLQFCNIVKTDSCMAYTVRADTGWSPAPHNCHHRSQKSSRFAAGLQDVGSGAEIPRLTVWTSARAICCLLAAPLCERLDHTNDARPLMHHVNQLMNMCRGFTYVVA